MGALVSRPDDSAPQAKPSHRRLSDLREGARLARGNGPDLHVGGAFDPSPDYSTAANLITLTGDGDNDVDLYTATGIPLGSGDVETIGAWVTGDTSATLADVSTYGAPNTGTVDDAAAHWIHDASSTWDVAPAAATLAYRQQHAITFYGAATGVALTSPRTILHVEEDGSSGSGEHLHFSPDLALDEVELVKGSTYKIHVRPSYRFLSLALYEEDLA